MFGAFGTKRRVCAPVGNAEDGELSEEQDQQFSEKWKVLGCHISSSFSTNAVV